MTAFECETSARIITEEAWPRQPRPGKQHRKVWKSFLTDFCFDNTLKLRQPMGDWLGATARQSWTAAYDPAWDRAMTKADDGGWLLEADPVGGRPDGASLPGQVTGWDADHGRTA